MAGTAVDVLGGSSSPGAAVDVNDGLSSSTAIKGPCRVATTANVTLRGEQTIDGVLTAESRVLVWHNTDARENGIYQTSTGDWRRVADFNRNSDVRKGTGVYVTSGAVGSGLYFVTVADPISIGTTSITFQNYNVLVSGALLAGNNLGDVASKIASFDILAPVGATVFSPVAGVLNLSAVVAPFVLLGAGAITAITLGATKNRFAWASADVAMTASAALEINGATAGSKTVPASTPMLFQRDGADTVTRVFILSGLTAEDVASAFSASPAITSNVTYCVKEIGGSDANDGLSAGTAFATGQHAADVIAQINFGVYEVTLTFIGDATGDISFNGLGNRGCSNSSFFNVNGSGRIDGVLSALSFEDCPVECRVDELTIGTGGILIGDGATVQIAAITPVEFADAGASDHVLVLIGGDGLGAGDYTISGDAACHVEALQGGRYRHLGSNTITTSGVPDFTTAFVQASALSLISFGLEGVLMPTFAGSGATGVRYISDRLSLVDGGGDPNYLPGDAPGVETNGGLYV